MQLRGIRIYGSRARFSWVKAPTSDELTQLTHTIAHRVARYLERQVLLERDAGNSHLTVDCVDADSESPSVCTKSMSSEYRCGESVGAGHARDQEIRRSGELLVSVRPNHEQISGSQRTIRPAGTCWRYLLESRNLCLICPIFRPTFRFYFSVNTSAVATVSDPDRRGK